MTTPLHFTESGKQLTELELKRVENDLKLKFPSEYREFMLIHNGGRPSLSCFNFINDKGVAEEDGIHSFSVIGTSETHSRLEDHIRTFDGRIPRNLTPIADNNYGDQICLVTRGEEFGAVYIWMHDFEHYPPTYSNVFKVADSFSKFIEGLHEFSWVTPLESALKRDDLDAVRSCLGESFDIESKYSYDRTLIEKAAIANALRVIEWLHGRGATLRNALQIAEGNVKYFPDHVKAVELLRRLYFKK